MGLARLPRRAHPLRRRSAAGPRPARVGAPRCHHRAAGQLLVVDRLRRFRGRRRSVQPRGGGAARIRLRRAEFGPDVVDGGGIRQGDRRPAAGPQCRFAAWSFGSAHRGARTGTGHRPDGSAHRRRAEEDGGAARRGAGRRATRHVRDGRGHRQTRRRTFPVPRPTLHLRDLAGTAQTHQSPAQARPDPAERTESSESDPVADVLLDQQPNLRARQGSPDEHAGLRGRQVDAARRTRSGSAPGCSTP